MFEEPTISFSVLGFLDFHWTNNDPSRTEREKEISPSPVSQFLLINLPISEPSSAIEAHNGRV